MHASFRKPRRGFTLIESVIAIGVVGILLATFLAVFGPATQNIRRSISIQDADRLKEALQREMHLLREGPDDDYATAFEKAFDWIAKSVESDFAVLLYNYRGDPSSIRADGTLEPYQNDEGVGVAGEDYVVQPAVRRLVDGTAPGELRDDLAAAEGRVFLVRMTQLVFKDGALTESDQPGAIVDPHSGAAAAGSEEYPEAVIAFRADFYDLRSRSVSYLEGLEFTAGDTDDLPRRLFSRNMGVRR